MQNATMKLFTTLFIFAYWHGVFTILTLNVSTVHSSLMVSPTYYFILLHVMETSARNKAIEVLLLLLPRVLIWNENFILLKWVEWVYGQSDDIIILHTNREISTSGCKHDVIWYFSTRCFVVFTHSLFIAKIEMDHYRSEMTSHLHCELQS